MLGLLGDKYWQLLDVAANRSSMCSRNRISCSNSARRRSARASSGAGRDASEANLAVLDHQLKTREPLESHEQAVALRWDTESPAEDATIAADLERFVRPPGKC